MGVHVNIAADRFPRQGTMLGAKVEVGFHYDLAYRMMGVVVRDDTESPFLTIFRLDDGRHVLASECQYAPAEWPQNRTAP